MAQIRIKRTSSLTNPQLLPGELGIIGDHVYYGRYMAADTATTDAYALASLNTDNEFAKPIIVPDATQNTHAATLGQVTTLIDAAKTEAINSAKVTINEQQSTSFTIKSGTTDYLTVDTSGSTITLSLANVAYTNAANSFTQTQTFATAPVITTAGTQENNAVTYKQLTDAVGAAKVTINGKQLQTFTIKSGTTDHLTVSDTDASGNITLTLSNVAYLDAVNNFTSCPQYNGTNLATITEVNTAASNAETNAKNAITITTVQGTSGNIIASTDSATKTVSLNVGTNIPKLNANNTFTGTNSFNGAVTIAGNLTVSGTTTTVNADNLAVKDALIELNLPVDTANSANNQSGLKVHRANSAHKFLYNDTDGIWKVGENTSTDDTITNSHNIILDNDYASATEYGLVKIGPNLTLMEDGSLSAANLTTQPLATTLSLTTWVEVNEELGKYSQTFTVQDIGFYGINYIVQVMRNIGGDDYVEAPCAFVRNNDQYTLTIYSDEDDWTGYIVISSGGGSSGDSVFNATGDAGTPVYINSNGIPDTITYINSTILANSRATTSAYGTIKLGTNNGTTTTATNGILDITIDCGTWV